MDMKLNGTWKLVRERDGLTVDARVPGTDFGALMNAGIIKNPLISGVDEEALETAADNYTFVSEFDVSGQSLQYTHAYLCCKCIDTLCECFINGKKAFFSESAYIPVRQDIKSYLQAGKNRIEFRFQSPYIYIKQAYEKHPLLPNPNGVNGIPYIRKPGCHFGWDWGACVPYCGILDDITVVFCECYISDIRIKQQLNGNIASVFVKAENADNIRLFNPDGEEITGNNGCFEIVNPKLWYTHDLCDVKTQPLYTVVCSNAEMSKQRKIGIREIKLDMSADKYGTNFRFVLNGEGIFAKGANLIPFSALFEDSDNSTVDYYIDLAKKSGFNMLRVWGGGSYASDYLLSRCDEDGILIWQDFCFACQLYPFYDGHFKSLVVEEAKKNIIRLDTHPCVALWCGNNEIEAMFSYVPKTSRLVSSYIDFSYRELKKLAEEMTDVPYIPSSPLGTKPFCENTSDFVGDTHMWNVWHGLKKTDYYQNRYTRFMSEFGLESLPSMKAIETFADKSQQSMDSAAFNNHQKCVGGNPKMMFYLTEMFNMPESFDSLGYMTGIVQAECVKNAAVHFRQHKGRCNGCLYWQYNDVWNCPSWSSVDFEGVPKALQYRAAEFFSPVAVTCRKEKGRARIVAHNDTLKTVGFTAKLEYFSFGGEKLKQKNIPVSLDANSYKILTDIPVKSDTVLRISWLDKTITEFFAPPRLLPLERAYITREWDGDTLVLKSDTLAYNVCVESDCVASDNYFTMVKGETKRIQFNKKPENVKIVCANNIKTENKPLKRSFSRLVYRLKPMNIANAFVYTVM